MSGTVQDVLEVDEDSLCGFGSEVGNVFAVDGGSDTGFEHEIEIAGCRQSRLAGCGRRNLSKLLGGCLNKFLEGKGLDAAALQIFVLQELFGLFLAACSELIDALRNFELFAF